MIPHDLLDRFTTHLKEALQKALSFALRNGRELLEPGDLIVGLVREKGAIGGELLLKNGISAEAAETFFRGSPSTRATVAAPDLTLATKQALERAVLVAHQHGHKYVGTEHLVAAVFEAPGEDVMGFLKQAGANLLAIREQASLVLASSSRFPEIGNGENEAPESPEESKPESADPAKAQPMQAQGRAARGSAIDAFTRELTKPETADALDPVIGRDSELERVIQILCRRTKNNPVLLGEPGVGKTAIVEGLAKRLASGDVPDALHGKRLLNLDLTLVVAGTMYRGEFEARLKQIMDEAKADPDVILFIDEIHNIVGAGSSSGSLDAANILKPALARGEIRCIGATTWAEYKKHIEPDAALERRFQPVTVEEPTAEATLEILSGIRDFYAKHHKVKYAPDVTEAAVRLAERFLTDRHFPDKAIDLLDEAAASVVARRVSKEKMERMTSLNIAIRELESQKTLAMQEKRLDEASEFATQVEKLEKQRETIKARMEKERAKDMPTVTAEDVVRVVARMTGAALATIQATERERLGNLSKELSSQLYGQSNAISAVAEAVSRSRLGLGDPRRPRASFLFVGPSGTGKTEMARQLAKHLFGREDALVKLDMSEFAEGHAVSKLVGAPAGYVGYREASKLTDAIRKRPHCVVLFDEFEKAHADVQNTLLQLLEDGQLTDATGRTIPFRHAYVILTSNIGSDQLGAKPLGFGGSDVAGFESTVRDALRERLRPELLNRLDRVVVFQPLVGDPLRQILERELAQVVERVTAQDVAFRVGDDVRDWLLKQPLPPEEGARAIRRLLERELVPLLAKLLTEQPNKKKITIKAGTGGLKGQ